MRYVVVLEKGSNTHREHFHLLLQCEKSVGRRLVEFPWSQGFSKARLVTSRDASPSIGYITSYIAKDAISIRASTSYGKGWFATLAKDHPDYCPF